MRSGPGISDPGNNKDVPLRDAPNESARELDNAAQELNRVATTKADLLRRSGERDRQLKESLAELERSRAEIASLHLILGRVDAERDEIASAHAILSATWSLRVGRTIVRWLQPFRFLLRGPARAVHRAVRRYRVRPERLAEVVAEFTAAGRPLATTLTQESRTEPASDTTASDRLRGELLRRRRNGPLLLDPDEWDSIISGASADTCAAVGHQRLAALGTAIANGEQCDAHGSTLVIDVTGAQLVNHCGTRTHARAVLDQALDAVPQRVRVLLWQSPRHPRLGPEFTDRTDGDWDPRNLTEVGAFLQLAPFIHPTGDTYIELIASPHVRRAGVWLDSIIGANPGYFLPTADHVFDYQFGVEAVGRLDRVLTLSECSADEANALGVDPSRMITTGCRPGLASHAADAAVDSCRFDEHIVVVGSGLPHKNLALGIAGCLPLVAESETLGVVAVANISAEQEFELREMLDHLGVRRDRLDVRCLITDAELDALIVRAKVVVVPSLHEGFSLPAMESIERGTPVVTSNIAAHRELLSDGGWIFDPTDVNSLDRALRYVIANRKRVLNLQVECLSASIRTDRFISTIDSTIEWLCEVREIASNAEPRTVGAQTTAQPRTFSLSKVCEVEDFSEPKMRDTIRDIFGHEINRFGVEFPDGYEYRKYWEVAMAIRAFDKGGLLDGTRTFLGVGAGNEPTIFHLTRFAKHVLATDLYDVPGWEESANVSMLTDPGSHWPFEWNPATLTVRNMDALSLELADESVSGVFSSSSVEHFGDRDAVRRSIDEAYRVLEPGGILSVSSEFRISGAGPGIPGALLFDEGDIADIFVGGRDWSLMEPFDPIISQATIATQQDFETVVADQDTSVDQVGGLWTHHVQYAVYPHLVLRHLGRRFTSFHLALRKRSA
jgi:glycosyltransferase involved in cell wall biosynthesis/SAM-dependent methyltransferase